MVVYSFSQINLYQQCPKKYQYRYLDYLERDFESSPDLILGTSVHSTLEWLYQQINIYKQPIKADILAKFHDYWNNNISEVGEKLIYKGDQHEEDYLRRGEHYLEEYYNNYFPFEGIKIVATELSLNFSLNKDPNSKDKQFRGIIDRLDKDLEGNFIINDYKTNKNLPPEDKEEYREQLTLYAYGIQQKYGKYLKNIKARLYYLHFNLLDERDITQEAIDSVLSKYIADINSIESSRFDYNMGVSSAFPARQNSYCKYCEYQNVCPLWQHLNHKDEIIDEEGLGKQTIKNLVDKYAELSKKSLEFDKEKDLIKEVLIKYIQNTGYEQLFGNKNKLLVSKTNTYSIKDKEHFQKFIIEHDLLGEAIDIPYYKINHLIKNNKLTVEEIKTYLDKKDSRKFSVSKGL